MVRFVVGSLPPASVASAVHEGRVARERQHDEPAITKNAAPERQLPMIALTVLGK